MKPQAAPEYEYIRRTHVPDPMSSWDHAMFALSSDEYRLTSYGPYRWTIRPDAALVDVGDLDEAIEKAAEEYDLPDWCEDVRDIETSADPEDIINSAELWDNQEWLQWLWDHVLDTLGVMGVRTRNGAVVFDRNMIIALPKDNPAMKRYSYLSLGKCLAWESEAARRGVSAVARSNRGFLRAYEAAGSARALSPEWRAKREGFIARHMAQAASEPWFDADGRPTRRHLALIMWAYSPQPSRLLRVMGILTVSELRAVAKAKSNPAKLSNPALYHVTYIRNLRSIAEFGLNPMSNVKGMATGSNNPLSLRCEGRIFLTEESGVRFWYGRLEEWAMYESDDPLVDGLTPIVLRVSDMPEMRIDEEGTNDARAEAWYVSSRIHNEAIEVWTGVRWACVADLDFEDGDEDLDALELAAQNAYDNEGILISDDHNPLLHTGGR